MHTINIHDAKTHLSKLIEDTLHGKEIIIAKAGKPVAKLSPITKKKPIRHFGVLKGKIKISDDFDAPLPLSILEDFEN
jgi:prevent-host-death family protein